MRSSWAQAAAVGVELAPGLERDGVQPPLGVGQLDPLAHGERVRGAAAPPSGPVDAGCRAARRLVIMAGKSRCASRRSIARRRPPRSRRPRTSPWSGHGDEGGAHGLHGDDDRDDGVRRGSASTDPARGLRRETALTAVWPCRPGARADRLVVTSAAGGPGREDHDDGCPAVQLAPARVEASSCAGHPARDAARCASLTWFDRLERVPAADGGGAPAHRKAPMNSRPDDVNRRADAAPERQQERPRNHSRPAR